MWYLGSPSQITPTRKGEAFASPCRYELVRRRHISNLQPLEIQQATAHLIRVLPHIDGWDADLSGHFSLLSLIPFGEVPTEKREAFSRSGDASVQTKV